MRYISISCVTQEYMVICHLTSGHNQFDTRIFEKQCVSLAKAGYTTYLVSQGVSGIYENVHIKGIKITKSRIYRMLFTVAYVYKEALKIDADIYQIHEPELLPYALKLKRKGKIVIFDSHEDYSVFISEKAYLPKVLRRLIQRVYNHYQSYAFKKVDALIAVTPALREKIKVYNRTFLITNYPIVRGKLESNLEISKREKTICFAGGVNREWNHVNIIRALKNVPNTVYNLCGKTDDNYLKEMKNEEGFRHVNYLGTISRGEVKSVYSSSQIGIAVAIYSANVGWNLGTLGNTKIFEFMEAGLPFICTNFTLWNEIVEKYNCGITVSPEDVDQIAENLNYLFNNPKLLEEMGGNGRKAVEEEYNWNTQEEVLLKLYNELSNK